ncbi:MAG TPA: TetR/AcrR family transcriptional regulator [Actinobacteria bacterium]|nr:TetR/AcrR family transcriptional regulator [Actinomycetota bacterium]
MARNRVGRRTEARIVAVIRELLGEVGLEGTTIQGICDRAGIRPGSFYNIFPTKEDAILRVVGEAIAAVDPHPDDGAGETLDELVEAYVRFLAEQPELARVYLQVAVNGGLHADEPRAHFLRHHRRRVDRFAAAIDRESPRADAVADAELLLGALDGLALRWALDPDFAFADHAKRALAWCRAAQPSPSAS